MPSDVLAALRSVLQECSSMTQDDVDLYIQKLSAQGRLQIETWA